jgi:hypothetical protein
MLRTEYHDVGKAVGVFVVIACAILLVYFFYAYQSGYVPDYGRTKVLRSKNPTRFRWHAIIKFSFLICFLLFGVYILCAK